MKAYRRMLASLLCLLLCLSLMPAALAEGEAKGSAAAKELEGSFVKDEDGFTLYLLPDGSYYEGWLKRGDTIYYFLPAESGTDEDGVAWSTLPYMAQGGQYYIDEIDYFFGPDGVLAQNGKVADRFEVDGEETVIWYYAEADGKLRTGWVQEGEDWYYYAPWRVEESPFQVKDLWYWFEADGKLTKTPGLKQQSWEFDGESYANTFYALADGTLVKDWLLLNGDWYYFNPWRCEDGSYEIDGAEYSFDADGVWLGDAVTLGYSGWLQDSSGQWVYYDGSGHKLKSTWLQEGGKTYYLDENGHPLADWQQVEGDWYYFYADNSMASSCWLGSRYVQADGRMAADAWVDGWYVGPDGLWVPSAWMQDDYGWWYRRGDGSYPVSCWEQIDGAWYLFNEFGYMLTGWQLLGGSWYYLSPGGAMLTGWQIVDGSWYYFYDYGGMASSVWIDGYYLGASGALGA